MPQLPIYSTISAALDSLGIAFCLFDRDDHTLLWNSVFLRFFPEHAGHVYKGEPYTENLHRFYSSRLAGEELANIDRYIADGVMRHRTQSRPYVFMHRGRRLRVTSVVTPDGGRVRIWTCLSERHGSAQSSEGPKNIPIDLLEYIADGATITDSDGRILAANSEFLTLYDVAPDQPVINQTLRQIVSKAWEKAGSPQTALQALSADSMRFVGAPYELELPEGRWRRVIAQSRENGLEYLTHVDITPLKRALAEIESIAMTDSLSGLLNRRRFEELFDEEHRRAVRNGEHLALIFVDIDHFKSINDTFGHPVGDECVRRISRIIGASIRRPGDVAARFGGDEFTVLLPDTDIAGANHVAGLILSSVVAEPWHTVAPDLHITVSIGVADAVVGMTGGDLIQRADAALYRAKRLGRARVEIATTNDADDVPIH